MKYFALVYMKDLLDNGQAYIWYNRQAHHCTPGTISIQQATYESVSEERLLKEVQKTYPQARLHNDTTHPGDYRCIKVR